MEKVGDAEAKANLQPPFYVRDIDARCPKGHRPSAKKDKKNTYREPQNEASKDKDKAKSHSSSTSANRLRPRLPRKTSVVVGEAMEAIQPPGSMLPR